MKREAGHAAVRGEPEQPVHSGRVSPDVGDEDPTDHDELEDDVGERLHSGSLEPVPVRYPGRRDEGPAYLELDLGVRL